MRYEPPPPAKFPWRWMLYGSLALYLFGDLHLFHGPLYRHIESRKNPPPEAVGPMRWVASVNGTPITYAQLERGVEKYLWRRGLWKPGETISGISDQRMQLIQQAVREKLIARVLISMYSRSNPLPDFDPGVADRELELFRSRFEDKEFAKRLKGQELTEAELREQFEDEAHETAWIDAKTAKAFAVSDEEVRDWYARYQKTLSLPVRTRASHIFLTTHRLTADQIANAKALLEQTREKILSGEISFDQAAAEISEDERTKAKGGDLGYFSNARIPEVFAEQVDELEEGELSQPLRSDIGWHLVRLDKRLPKRDLDFDEVGQEIHAFLETEKRRITVMSLIRERGNFANVNRFPINEQGETEEAE